MRPAAGGMRRWMLTLAGAGVLAGAVLVARGQGSLPVEGTGAGFEGASGWLNSAPLTAADLKGKVVLVDFWTYSCINCLRTMPYIRAWAEKYRAQGLVVVGVHSPEFRFEQSLANVQTAVQRLRIDFPVALDSSQAIWQAWGNRFWPAYYLLDGNGKIRYHQYGEGDYGRTEAAIQRLLAEAHGTAPTDHSLVRPEAKAEQSAPDLARLGSDETYLGYGKAERFHSPQPLRPDQPQRYSVSTLRLNQWGLAGNWLAGEEKIVAQEAGASIAYQFSARDLHLVLGPGAAGRPLRIQLTLDGEPPGADHGSDIDAAGMGLVDATRLYQLVRQGTRVGPRRCVIRFLDAGAEAYAFTFG
ncbi:redoxin family protein [Pseudoduganella danionis]|uniref:Redoxin family protein n=2 Tax=Pseudoduganella danionis TaxID=1890295 RepID=A0ABW9SJ32_9BURK|nr:redoxin family protein [Pseudoduganella danionis]